MSYENATINWSANQVASMVRNGKIVFDSLVQRSLVWEKQRKSLFIHSLAISFPIPATYAKRTEVEEDGKVVKKYSMLDGRQRFTTIAQFINNEFELTELEPVTFFNDLTNEEETLNISGMKFEDMPEGLQEKIKGARINVVHFDNLNFEEEQELFKRLNNGKPLTAKNKSLASCKDLMTLLDIGKADLFDDMLSEKAKENKSQVPIIMKMWMMRNFDISELSFASKDFNPIMENTTITHEQRDVLEEMFDYIMNVHTILYDAGEKKLAKKLYTETHLVSLTPFFKKAIDNGYSEEWFTEWIEEFYGTTNGASISDEYNEASVHAAAKNGSIVTRHNALMESFDNFFSEKVEEEQVDADWEDDSEDEVEDVA